MKTLKAKKRAAGRRCEERLNILSTNLSLSLSRSLSRSLSLRRIKQMTRLQWLECWDLLREKLNERTSWGRNQIIEEMDKIERAKIRETDTVNNQILFALRNSGIDTECGACVEVAFTSLTTLKHTCGGI